MMKTFALISATACSAWQSVVAEPPDTVLLGGKIVTLDGQERVVEALAIRDGRPCGKCRRQRKESCIPGDEHGLA